MSTTPPPGSTSASPSKKSRWSKVGTVMRRSSTAFTIPGIRAASPSPSEPERDPDSASIKGSSKPGSTRQLEISAAGNGSGMAPSPIAESPAREAAALASEPAGPSPLAGDVTASPESMLEPPIINEIPPTPAAPAAEQLAPVAEPKVAPAAAEVPISQPSSNPPTEEGEEKKPPSIHVEDTSIEQAAVESAGSIIEPAVSIAEAPAQEVEASNIMEAAAAEQSAPAIPDPVTSFEIAAPQPIVASSSSADYSTQIWASQGQSQIPQGGISAKPSIASLASSAAWTSNAHGNEDTGYDQDKLTMQMSAENPFADPQTHDADPGVSPADTIRVPEPLDPRSPREDAYQPVISMPLPAMADVIPGQSVRKMISGYSLSAKSSSGPVEPVGQVTNERIPLLSRSTPPQGQGKTFYVQGGSSHLTPSIRSNITADIVPRMRALGWSEYILPDAAIYFVHPTFRVITDIDLKNMKQLEIVTDYLERDGEGFKVPQGCELWLRDAAEGKRRECVPVRSWVDHGKRTVSFEPPWERDAHGSHHLHEDDKLDGQYRYWSFMEAHPAHTPISAAAHAEATDVLTWSYTDRLLPLSRPVPPPFTQEECQELMGLLRSFGATPDVSGIQTVVHTRIVARILLRIARWHQTHFRPHRSLPHDAHKASHRHPRRRGSFVRAVFDFVVGFIFLGIPYIFIDRAHHHRMDEESGLHGAGPMLAIGACSCLAAAIILSASVTFMSFPGLDNVARIAAFVAILCSAASMTASVIALFRYKADMERTVWHYDMGGAGLMLNKRSILMSLPLVFLVYSLAGLITSVVLYSFKGPSITPPGLPVYYDNYTKWGVLGTLGGLAGVLIISALVSRR